MALEIVKVRVLSEEELDFLRLADEIDLLSNHLSRREALMTIAGGALAATFPVLLAPKFAHAQAKDLAIAFIEGAIELSKGLFYQQESIEAQFDLVNETELIQRKYVYNAIKSPQLGVTDQAYSYTHLAPESATTVKYSGFVARNPGRNDYLAKTQIDSAEKAFSVEAR